MAKRTLYIGAHARCNTVVAKAVAAGGSLRVHHAGCFTEATEGCVHIAHSPHAEYELRRTKWGSSKAFL